jgi:ABC-type spermidine/putrescine transport system permease subunit I
MNIQEVFCSRKALTVILVLIALSPLFAYAAEAVNYSEPLENTAEEVGAEEHPVYSGVLPDYTVPGLDPYVGTLIAGLVGTFITLFLAYALSWFMAAKKGK